MTTAALAAAIAPAAQAGGVRGAGFRHGRFRDSLTFPRRAAGHPIVVRVLVHTAGGDAHADHTVRVRA